MFVCVNERPPDDPRGSCHAKGGAAVRDRLKAELKARGLAKTIRANNAGCLDQCARGVSVVVYPEQVWYGGVTVDDVVEIVEKHLIGGEVVERLLMPDQPHVDARRRLPIVSGAALLGVLVLGGGVARADDGKPASDPPPTKPDPLAQAKAEDANLESDAPRQGVTISFAVGGGLVVGNGTSETIPAASLRLGHVATPNTVITLEIAGGTFQHKESTTSDILYDTSGSALAGALYYVTPSLWIRGAGGVNVHTQDNGTAGTSKMVGPAGAFGAGVDLIRRRFWVFGAEMFAITAINRNGLLVTGAMGIGLSHY
ncbi:MAG TPA: (2Fe-2S) ferredoxin domain-containing protein [Kofleriaceae bacterium]|nr:(2Fe-2S) ferredoxin domain-containing protein [Kofleriaceae bacterium]